MKRKSVTVSVFLLALFIAMLLRVEQNIAQSSSEQVKCNVDQITMPNTKLKSMDETKCGECTVYRIRAGWQPSDGIEAKYEKSTIVAYATVAHCKSEAGSSCLAITLAGSVSCPPTPNDLATGTNTDTDTDTDTDTH